MKNIKPSVFLTLLLVGVGSLVLLPRPGASQNPPPPYAASFNAHYSDVQLSLAASATSNPIPLPVVNRAVRLTITFAYPDGDISLMETTVLYNSNPGHEGLTALIAGSQHQGEIELGAVAISGASGGLVVRNLNEVGGSVRITMLH